MERALRWLWDQNEVGMVLSGMSSIAQVTENLKVVSESSIGELSDDERSLYGEARAAYQGQKAMTEMTM